MNNRVHSPRRAKPSRHRFRKLLLLPLVLALPQLARAASISLEWNPNPEPSIAGYRVHYGKESRQYSTSLDVGPDTKAQVSGLSDGSTYYFAVTAYNADGFEGPPSAEVTHKTPSTSSPPAEPSPSPDNNVPKGVPDQIVITPGATAKRLGNGAWTVLGNDVDADGDSLSAVLVAKPAHGSLDFNSSNGTFTYIHSGGSSTDDEFRYAPHDGASQGTPVTVSISVLKITSLRAAGKDISISFSTAHGFDYSVQSSKKSSPSESSWSTLATFNGDGSTLTCVDKGAAKNPTRHYRVLCHLPWGNLASDPVSKNSASTSSTKSQISIDVSLADEEGETQVADAGVIVVLPGHTAKRLAAGDWKLITGAVARAFPNLRLRLVNPPSHGNLDLNASNGTFSYAHSGNESTSDTFTFAIEHDGAEAGRMQAGINVLRITSLSASSSGTSVSYSTAPGLRYSLQSRAGDDEWRTVESVTGTGSIVTSVDTKKPGTRKLYRVVCELPWGLIISEPVSNEPGSGAGLASLKTALLPAELRIHKTHAAVLHGIGGGLTLQFDTQTGFIYTIEAAPDLVSNRWEPIAIVHGAGGTETISHSNPGGAHRFYRVLSQSAGNSIRSIPVTRSRTSTF